MTLSRHVLFLKIGIGIALCALAAFVIFTWEILPFYPLIGYQALERSGKLFSALHPSAYIPYATTLAALIYAFVFQVLIFYFFEKTQSREMRFMSVFVFSFVFEIFRAMIPFQQAFDLPGYYINLSAHLLMFGRFYGIFSLFAASLFVCGLKSQKEENVLFTIIIITMLISLRLPLNVLTWDTSLAPIVGKAFIFDVFETLIILLSVASFCVGAYIKKTREYFYIGLGIVAVFTGREFLFHSDVWISVAVGFVLLVGGTWFIGMQVRRMYLWV
ncbi:MAG: hypothetical protein LBV52_05200 [Spirochaetaceae bacterium]|jgi:hypothetical protein|nr:hypothetical protein [Spirochaetaceae bacterium]